MNPKGCGCSEKTACHRPEEVVSLLAAFVADLRSTPIVTHQNVAVIKNYIADKYPGLSFEKSTLMLADAVRQIVDQKIRTISEKYRGTIRENLFRNITRRMNFQINAADVLEASLPLHRSGEDLAGEICHWIHQTIKKMVSLETLHTFYHQLSDRYAKDTGQNLDILAARIDQANMLKEKAALSREERMRQRRIAQIRLDSEADKAQKVEVNIPEPITNIEEAAFSDTAASKPVPAPAGKRAGYLSRRIAVLTTAAGMVILALFMMNLVRESVRETAVLASSPVHRPVGRIADVIPQETTIEPGTSTSVEPGIYQPDTANVPASGDIGRSDVETKPSVDNQNLEFWAEATAYDLSFESCGKTREHPLYGITRSGAKASAGRTIAVDPDVIPLGSKVYITFPENYGYLDGIYIAEDTGRSIKGRRIDLFLGEDLPGERSVYQDALKFGIQKVKLEILGEE